MRCARSDPAFNLANAGSFGVSVRSRIELVDQHFIQAKVGNQRESIVR